MSKEETKQHLVIFLGAGFSAPFGLPVMGNFSDRLRSDGCLGDRQSDFDAIQRQCDVLGAFIGGSARNLEQLASFLAMLEITRPAFEFPECKTYRTPAKAMELILEGMRRMVSPVLQGHAVKEQTRKFFGLGNQARITFITTNYDLVIEFAALAHDSRTAPTDDIAKASQSVSDASSLYRPSGHPGTVQIYKLHGSINWLVGPSGELQVASMFNPQAAPPLSTKWWTELLPGVHAARNWLMVPPAVLKPDLMGLLGPQWQGASEAIATADLLWFVGYSFAESDSFMRYFLASALFTNVRLRQLAVIDPTVEVGRRAKQLFRMPSLEQVFVTIPMAWQNIHYDYLLQGNVPAAAGNLNIQQLAYEDTLWRVFRGHPSAQPSP